MMPQYTFPISSMRVLEQQWVDQGSQTIHLCLELSTEDPSTVIQSYQRHLWEVYRYFQQPQHWYRHYGNQIGEPFINHLQRATGAVSWAYLSVSETRSLPLIQVSGDLMIAPYLVHFCIEEGIWWEIGQRHHASQKEYKLILSPTEIDSPPTLYHQVPAHAHQNILFRAIKVQMKKVSEEPMNITWHRPPEWKKFTTFVE